MSRAFDVTGMAAADPARHSPVADQLRALEQMPLLEVRTEWRRLVGTEPPRLSRDLLVRALAYRVQERAFGGLSRASLRQLKVVDGSGEAGPSAPAPTPSLRPGARLVREWHGRSHVVSVTETGFDYAGASYRSLTEIAKLITGAHWSGPRFFGLTDRKGAAAACGG